MAIPPFLRRLDEHLYEFAPIPMVYRVLDDPDLEQHHRDLLRVARARFRPEVLDVPDERHLEDLGSAPDFTEPGWVEEHPPAVGIWHCVPVNHFLELDDPAVVRLRRTIEAAYLDALTRLGEDDGRAATITESWIQTYRDGDRKVMHNHERYGPPVLDRMWAGGYYLDDGGPDPTMKYAGALSFEVRGSHYLLRPRPGLLVMWPADVLHEVHPFYGARERVVVNFNVSLGPEGRASTLRRLARRVRRRLG